MYCNQCGSLISENSKFCRKCGTRVQQKEMLCPQCGAPYEADSVYCEECGARLTAAGSSPAPEKNFAAAAVPEPAPAPAVRPAQPEPPAKPAHTGELFKKVLVSLYNGEVRFGAAKTSGYLYVYDDHISYSGNVSANLLKMFRGGEGISIPMEEITDVKDSRFMGVFPSMVITIRNGQKYTFAASVGGGAIPEIVQFMKKYIG